MHHLFFSIEAFIIRLFKNTEKIMLAVWKYYCTQHSRNESDRNFTFLSVHLLARPLRFHEFCSDVRTGTTEEAIAAPAGRGGGSRGNICLKVALKLLGYMQQQ